MSEKTEKPTQEHLNKRKAQGIALSSPLWFHFVWFCLSLLAIHLLIHSNANPFILKHVSSTFLSQIGTQLTAFIHFLVCCLSSIGGLYMLAKIAIAKTYPSLKRFVPNLSKQFQFKQRWNKNFRIQFIAYHSIFIFMIGLIIFMLCSVKHYTNNLGLSQLNNLYSILYITLSYILILTGIICLVSHFIIQKAFQKSAQMSREDLKKELIEREGHPLVKYQRKQFFYNIKRHIESLNQVKHSDLVITNPTHIAICLSFDPQTMFAPTVVCKGQSMIAQLIKKIASTYQLPIIESPAIARKLFHETPIKNMIQPVLYEDIAFMYAIKVKKRFTS